MGFKILIAEDDLELSRSILDLLENKGYSCEAYDKPHDVLAAVERQEFDLLISDLKLPDMDGITLASNVLSRHPDIRVIIITAYSSMPSVIEALRLGVDHYILKPFSSEELLFQIKRALERRSLILQNRKYQRGLAKIVEEQTAELLDRQTKLRASQMENIFAIGNIIEARDYYTRGHTERVTCYAVAMAEAMSWDKQKIHDLGIGTPLHDIGKIGVPDFILKKKGALTFKEYEKMKEHPETGYELVKETGLALGTIACILYHHERFDGKGYPFGLKGTDIPDEGRLMAICDAFDAMTSNRIYRAAMTTDRAVDIVRKGAGTQFDPDYAKVFLGLIESGSLDDLLFQTDLSGVFNELVESLIAI